MVQEYDLVIIGDTPEGRYAAFRAIDLKFRVALVEQPFQARIDNLEIMFRRRWSYLSRFCRQRQYLENWEIIDKLGGFKPFFAENLSWWSFEDQSISLRQLGEMGGDIILESGYFEQKKELYWVTSTRKLKSSQYLIATGSSYSKPEIQGLREVNYLDFLTIFEKWPHLPKTITIVAETALGIELAQGLNRLGKKVILIVEDYCLLPQQEREIVRYLQAQLEAEGIQLFVNSPVTQVKAIDGEKWIQIGSHAVACDEIIITAHPLANLEGLNLEKIGVKYHQKTGIEVNHKLQTSHPQVYATGSVIADQTDLNVAKTQVDIILKNMMGFSIFQFKNPSIPFVIFTDPTFTRIGLTELQSRKIYGDKIRVVEENFQGLFFAKGLDEMNGKLKIITHDNGQILGAHILGYNAEEYIGAIALAMQQEIPLQKLYQSAFLSASFSSIFGQVALKWKQQQLKHYASWPRFIQAWFI